MEIFNILNLIENMTISELNNLLNLLEKKYNFSKKISSEASLSSPSLNENLKLEKYSLYLLNIGKNKISLIKTLKDLNNLGLKEAKDLVESCPSLIKKGLSDNDSKILKEKLELIGASCEIRKDE